MNSKELMQCFYYGFYGEFSVLLKQYQEDHHLSNKDLAQFLGITERALDTFKQCDSYNAGLMLIPHVLECAEKLGYQIHFTFEKA